MNWRKENNMKIFYDSNEEVFNIYTQTRYGLKKIASFDNVAEALSFIEKMEVLGG